MASANETEPTLLVLAAPSVNDEYYAEKFTDIIEYMATFANLVHGKDQVVILVDAATRPHFHGKVPPEILIKANLGDIWIRDVSPVIPNRQVKFKFAPRYLDRSTCRTVEGSFATWVSQHGLQYYTASDIILDGGNVVDNPSGTRAIVTARIVQDNPSLTKATAKAELRELLGVNEIAIVKETPGDTTGHADGMVMWIDDDRLLLVREDEPTHSEVVNELKSSFPGVEVIEIPNFYIDETWRGFTSARNVYVNSIVTDDYIYMPVFGNAQDAEMLSLFRSLTDKIVVPVPTENICMMGGSVRCLSWQIKGWNKTKLLDWMRQ